LLSRKDLFNNSGRNSSLVNFEAQNLLASSQLIFAYPLFSKMLLNQELVLPSGLRLPNRLAKVRSFASMAQMRKLL
jgi:hypothetical protein